MLSKVWCFLGRLKKSLGGCIKLEAGLNQSIPEELRTHPAHDRKQWQQ